MWLLAVVVVVVVKELQEHSVAFPAVEVEVVAGTAVGIAVVVEAAADENCIAAAAERLGVVVDCIAGEVAFVAPEVVADNAVVVEAVVEFVVVADCIDVVVVVAVAVAVDGVAVAVIVQQPNQAALDSYCST